VIQLIVEQGLPFSIVTTEAIHAPGSGPRALTREIAGDIIIEDVFAFVQHDFKAILESTLYLSFTFDVWRAG
jgi:hypothetical protein